MIAEARRQGWSVEIAFGQIYADKTDDPLVSDTVLSAAGALLTKRLRAEDLKGYWGKDKVIVAFRNEDLGTVNGLVRKVGDELASMQLPGAPGQEFCAGIGFGVAQFPNDAESLHELMSLADQRLQEVTKRLPAEKPVNA